MALDPAARYPSAKELAEDLKRWQAGRLVEAHRYTPGDLLRRFVREFKPEQIKRYLSKEVIGGLSNASAIDLSQFAGLNAERG